MTDRTAEPLAMEAIPHRMRSVVVRGPGDYRLEEVDTPRPGRGDLLIKVEAVGVCASDLKCYHGAAKFWGDANRPAYVQTGVIPGHEFVGVVVAGDEEGLRRHRVDIGARIVAENNIFFGSNTIVGIDRGSVRGSNNWLPAGAQIPAMFTDSTKGAEPGFRDAAARDFHLTADSPCRDIGMSAPMYIDASGASQPGIPGLVAGPYGKQDFKRRKIQGKPDAGAYEYVAAEASLK